MVRLRFNIVAAGIEPVRPTRDLRDWNPPERGGSPNQGRKLEQIRREAASGSLTGRLRATSDVF
jgi:hypothetical protein